MLQNNSIIKNKNQNWNKFWSCDIFTSLLQHENYIEKMGTGIFRIRKALADAGNPEAIFDHDAFFTVIFKRIPEKTITNSKDKTTPEIAQETTLETAQETTLETTPETAQETAQEKIVALIRENSGITRNEMSRITGLTPDSIKHNLAKMVKAGIIKHNGPTKSGFWQVIKNKKEN